MLLTNFDSNRKVMQEEDTIFYQALHVFAKPERKALLPRPLTPRLCNCRQNKL